MFSRAQGAPHDVAMLSMLSTRGCERIVKKNDMSFFLYSCARVDNMDDMLCVTAPSCWQALQAVWCQRSDRFAGDTGDWPSESIRCVRPGAFWQATERANAPVHGHARAVNTRACRPVVIS